MAADEDEIVIACLKLPRLGLIKGRAAGGEENRMHRRADLVAHRAPAAPQGVALHDGAPSAAVGVIVNLILAVDGIVPDLVGVNFNQALFLRPAEDAGIQHGRNGLREQGHDIKAHGVTSLR